MELSRIQAVFEAGNNRTILYHTFTLFQDTEARQLCAFKTSLVLCKVLSALPGHGYRPEPHSLEVVSLFQTS